MRPSWQRACCLATIERLGPRTLLRARRCADRSRFVSDDRFMSDLLGTGYQVHDRDGCRAVIDALARNFENHPDEWENPTIPAYLDAMSAWLADSNQSAVGVDSWSTLADALQAGRVYE